jgi:hypothetical protein
MGEYAGGAGSLQTYIHFARESAIGLRVWGPEDYPNPSNHACMSCKGCEQPVLGVRTSPGADGVVAGGNLDTHEFMSYKAKPAPKGQAERKVDWLA